MLQLRSAPLRRCGPVAAGWQSLASVPRRWLIALFVACALFAGGMALFSSDRLHRLWGYYAVGAYLLAALVLLAWRSARSVDLALLAALAGALIAPLVLLADTEQWQPEVWVIARAARLLIGHGTPYESQALLAGTHNPNLYNPYLPVMAVFGLPRALLGQVLLTDPRIWFGASFVVLFAAALAAAGARDVVRWTVLVTASPVIAFSLTVGGTDVPVLGLVCLGLALLWHRPRALAAGLVLGIAAATKATAWPALVVAALMLAVRDGWRVMARFAATALAVAAVLIAPVAARSPGALLQNTILFPLGLAHVKSQAVSPLPGHVLADTGHAGHLAAVLLLVATGLGVALWLVLSPPRTVPSATWRLIVGLALMFTLAPATRFGYYLYPVGLCAWLIAVQLGSWAGAGPGPGPADPARSG